MIPIERSKLRFKESRFDENTTIFFRGKKSLRVDKLKDDVFQDKLKIKKME